jgi:hypothetical protein
MKIENRLAFDNGVRADDVVTDIKAPPVDRQTLRSEELEHLRTLVHIDGDATFPRVTGALHCQHPGEAPARLRHHSFREAKRK